MAIDAKEALKVLGYDPEAFETVDDFRAQVETDWLRAADAPMNKDVQKHVFGKINGALRTTIKKAARELEVEGEWDSMDPTDGIRALTSEVATRMAELREAKKDHKDGTATAKEVAEVQRRYDEAKKKADDLAKLYEESTAKYTELEERVAAEKRQAQIDGLYNEALGGLKLRKMNALERSGFEAAIRSEFAVKFDDEGKPYVTGKDGERLRDASKAHGHLNLAQALQGFAETNGLIEKEAPAPVQRRTIPMDDRGGPTPPPQAAPPTGRRTVAERVA